MTLLVFNWRALIPAKVYGIFANGTNWSFCYQVVCLIQVKSITSSKSLQRQCPAIPDQSHCFIGSRPAPVEPTWQYLLLFLSFVRSFLFWLRLFFFWSLFLTLLLTFISFLFFASIPCFFLSLSFSLFSSFLNSSWFFIQFFPLFSSYF